MHVVDFFEGTDFFEGPLIKSVFKSISTLTSGIWVSPLFEMIKNTVF